MSEAAALGIPGTRVSSGRAGWIQGRGFDLAFFVFPAVLTLPIVLASLWGVSAIAAFGFFLAFAHYFSTLTFFFWEENRPVHRQRWALFFGGPILIVLLFVMLVVLKIPLIIQVAILFWNSFHVARQNAGILSIYRHNVRAFDPAQRNAANAAIIALALWLTLWNVGSNTNVMAFFNLFSPMLVDLLWIGFGAWALYALFRLGKRLYERWRRGDGLYAPELLFLASSLVFFHPYLWIEDSGGATFVMLLPHYVQYLAIVWLIHRRKFATADGPPSHRVLHRLSHSIPILIVVLLSIGAALLATKILMTDRGLANHFEGFYLTVAFIHFYLDGLIWAFRDPHVRSTLGPYLLNRTDASTAA